MSQPNNQFFVTGGTLPIDAASYVERRADAELYDSLLRGEFCYVLDTRQMGKSSLMVRTVKRLQAAGVRVVVLDLTAVGQNLTPEQWYFGLLMQLAVPIDLEHVLVPLWRRHSELSILQRFLVCLRHALAVLCAPAGAGLAPAGRLAIFVDEIDAVRSLPFSADEFFAGIRECYNRRATDALFTQLTFCLLGVASPADLIRDVRTTPFNIGRRVVLTDFQPDEAAPLASGLPADTSKAKRLLRRVLHWTGGHPYLTQRLCRVIAAELGAGEQANRRTGAAGVVRYSARPFARSRVDAACIALFFTKQARETDDNLAFIRNRLLRSETDTAGLLDLYGKVLAGRRVRDDDTNPLCEQLRLSGIVRVENGWLRVRNPIYARVFDHNWVRTHMPDAEVRRQRAAFRLGIARTAAVASALLALMTGLAVNAQNQARVARYARARADRLNGSLQAALTGQRAANARLAQALRDATAQKGRADAAATRARLAQSRERAMRSEADHARRLADLRRSDADSARRDALRQRDQLTSQVRRMDVASGIDLMNAGDTLGALTPLTEALKLDSSNPALAQRDRMRIGSALSRSPRLLQVWLADGAVCCLDISPNGRCVVAGDSAGAARIWSLDTGAQVGRAMMHRDALLEAKFSPDGGRVVTLSRNGAAWIWDTASGRLCAGPLGPKLGARDVAWSPRGDTIAVAAFGAVYFWSVAGRPKGSVDMELANTRALAFSPDGARIAIVNSNYLAWIADVRTGALLTNLGYCYRGDTVEFSPDGKRVLIVGDNSDGKPTAGIVLFDAETGARVGTVIPNPVTFTAAVDKVAQKAVAARYSRDGHVIAIAFDDRSAGAWDAQTAAPLGPLVRPAGGITDVAISADGQRIATACTDGTAQIWDVAHGRPVGPPVRHAGPVQVVRFDPRSNRLLTAGLDHTVRLWATNAQAAQTPLPGPWRYVTSLNSWSYPLGRDRVIMHQGETPVVRVWDLARGRPLFPTTTDMLWDNATVSRDADRVMLHARIGAQVWDVQKERPFGPVHRFQAELSPNGGLLLARMGRNRVQVWDVATDRPLSGLIRADAAVFAPHDEMVALLSGSVVALYAPRRWRALRSIETHSHHVYSAAFSPDGARLVTASDHGWVRVWDPKTGRPLAPAQDQRGITYFTAATSRQPERNIVFSANAGYAVTLARDADYARQPLLWNLRTGRPLVLREGPLPFAAQAMFSPDATHLVLRGEEVTLYDLRSLRRIASLPSHDTANRHNTQAPLVFSPDGSILLAPTDECTLRLLSARTGAPAAPPLQHDMPVSTAAFTPDGRTVLTASTDGRARLWDASSGEPLTSWLEHGSPIVAAWMDPSCHEVVTVSEDCVRIWRLEPEQRPLTRLLQSCRLLSGRRMTARTGIADASPEEVRQALAAAGDSGVRQGGTTRSAPASAQWQHATSVRPADLPAGDPYQADAAHIQSASYTLDRYLSPVRATSGDWRAAMRECDAAVRATPDDPAAYIQRSVVEQRCGKQPEADIDFAAAVTVSGLLTVRPLGQDEQRAAAYAQDRLRADAGQWTRTVAELSAATAWTESAPWAYRYVGFAYAAEARYELAAQSLRKAIEASPADPWLRILSASCSLQSGRQQEAALQLDAAIALAPSLWQALAFRAAVECELGRYDAACADAARARALLPPNSPNETPLRRALSRYLRLAGHWQDAATIYASLRLSFVRQGDNAAALRYAYLQALCLLRAGDIARYRALCAEEMRRVDLDRDASDLASLCALAPSALTDYAPLLRSLSAAFDPRAFDAALDRAIILCRSGQWSAALQTLRGAEVGATQQEARANLVRALCFRGLGDAAAARRYAHAAYTLAETTVHQMQADDVEAYFGWTSLAEAELISGEARDLERPVTQLPRR